MTSPATAPQLTGSIQTVMDNLVEMEKRISDDIVVHMWKPTTPDPLMIYNWLTPSPFAIVDQVKWRDTLNVIMTLAVQHTDVEIEMARAVSYVDTIREVVDTELYAKRPLGGHRAMRVSMQTSAPRFGPVAYLGFDFGLVIHVDRMIQPNA